VFAPPLERTSLAHEALARGGCITQSGELARLFAPAWTLFAWDTVHHGVQLRILEPSQATIDAGVLEQHADTSSHLEWSALHVESRQPGAAASRCSQRRARGQGDRLVGALWLGPAERRASVERDSDSVRGEDRLRAGSAEPELRAVASKGSERVHLGVSDEPEGYVENGVCTSSFSALQPLIKGR